MNPSSSRIDPALGRGGSTPAEDVQPERRVHRGQSLPR